MALQLCFGQATIVLRRRFEPATAYADLVEHAVVGGAFMPVMIQRLHEWRSANTGPRPPALRVVATSDRVAARHLPGALCDDSGRSLCCSLYGSTEAALGDIAAPEQLRAESRQWPVHPLATRVALLDADSAVVPGRRRGAVLASRTRDGLTRAGLGGADGHRHDGLIATGDPDASVDGAYYVGRPGRSG